MLLYVIPYGNTIGYPLILLSTLAHEMGHGLAAVVVGGDFHKFYLHADASGVAYTSTRGNLAGAFVSAGGLVGPAIVGALFFAMAHRAKALFFVLGLGLVLAEVFVVRNLFGFNLCRWCCTCIFMACEFGGQRSPTDCSIFCRYSVGFIGIL